jgi:class 3 adenylate cyclase/tetratricopeptide (TPR) repeat protein
MGLSVSKPESAGSELNLDLHSLRVQVCPSCGEENPARFRLCGFCGTPLVQAVPPQEVRKTVTIVFSDLQGSTSLGEKLDSESLREVLSRYFEVMRSVLEEHGGSIEKYIGDAIMAVFGLPRVHEDDALRAVAAAAGMKQALAGLNDELERRWGVRLVNRTGVNTGEVVAGDHTTGQRLVSGDTVNVAARLEQAAPPLETLIGEATYRLVRHAVELERVEPLELKGKAERVPAYRLIGTRPRHAAIGRADVPMVGREAELGRLLTALSKAKRAWAPRVVLVVGDPGVGKSRLTQELTNRAARAARVLGGRCLSYGRGITFWPLVEIVRGATGIRDSDPPEVSLQKLEALLPGAPDVVARVASAVGLGEAMFPLQEIYWGTRKLFEALATERPLVVLVEDVHWAEAAFLDLLEYLAAHVTAPVLLVCSGRPELLEMRPSWRDQPGWLQVALEPLTPAESGHLVDSLLGSSNLPPLVRERVGAAAEGNPLFVEQLVAMLVDDGFIQRKGDGWEVTGDLSGLALPGSIQALLGARLDLLSVEERAVLEPASVIGLSFPEDALGELVPDAVRPTVERHLSHLTRKRLVTREADQPSGRWYRFQHILIRDTAYNRLLKRTRASLHERFANWGERVNPDREGTLEYAEILGYHLEQAYRYLSDLGPLDEHGRQLGMRGAAHLGGAGTRAFERGDMSAASHLLQRAVALLPERDPGRVALLPRLSEARMESGEFTTAEAVLDEAVQAATAVGDTRLLADAILSRLLVRRHAAGAAGAWFQEVERETRRLIPLLQDGFADAELAKAWRLAAFVHANVCQWQQAAVAQQRALQHARRAGRRRLEARMSAALAQALRDGPTPVPEAIRRCETMLAAGLVDQQAEVLATVHLAYLHALAGDLATARGLYRQARSRLSDLGGAALTAASVANITIGRIELLAGDVVTARAELRRDYEALGEIGERYFRPTIGALLGQALCASGLHQEAIAITTEVAMMAPEDDVEAQAIWRAAQAKALASVGRVDDALRLIEQAVRILAATDALVWKAEALSDQGLVLIRAGRNDEAAAALRGARELYTLKGAPLPLHGVDALLAGLQMLAAPSAQPIKRGRVGKKLVVSRRS